MTKMIRFDPLSRRRQRSTLCDIIVARNIYFYLL